MKKGFTLIELLIVIVLLAILSGVIIQSINTKQVRLEAEDAVKLSTLEKLVQGVESYRGMEGSYPAATTDLGTYIKIAWPTGYTYAKDGNEMSIRVTAGAFTGCFKYHSASSQIKKCSGTSCSQSTSSCTVVN